MFRRSDAARKEMRYVQIWLDGVAYHVPSTLSVAAAVLQTRGWQDYRRHHDGSQRAPLCMMGACHECLITIDGMPKRQGCLEGVAEGMRIERQGDETYDV